MDKKVNYFYIDEAGHLNNDSKVFIHGCVKTDTPTKIENLIKNLKGQIKNEIYFDEFVEKFSKQGFHAVENHFDIRARFYGLLPTLNYRAYFVLINKDDKYFNDLLNRFEIHEIFLYTLKKLLLPRLMNKQIRNDKNVLLFEEIEFPRSSLETVLNKFGSTALSVESFNLASQK
jgi:hypothetical protein